MTELVNLKLKNFKSFKRAKIPLRNGFTVVIGANGSGKSNILDAVLFVLGATSLKSLRVSRLTDLVNAGAREDYAKVELTIREKETDYIISRTIDKTGKSVFRLNDERKAMHEIKELLNNLNIKGDGHNIASQGDITKIISYSPEQRRQLLDELSGISEFDEKKKEAEKELDVVNDKTKQARMLLNEKEKRLKEIEEDKKAAMEFGVLKEKVTKVKGSILTAELKEMTDNTDDIDKKVKKRSEEKELMLKERNLLIEQENLFSKEFEDINNALLGDNQKIYKEIISLIEEKKSEEKVLREKNNHLTQMIKEKQNQIELGENSVKEKLSRVSSLKKRLTDINNEITSLEEKIRQEEKGTNVLIEKIHAKESAIRQLNVKIEEKNKEVEKKLIESTEIKKENSLNQQNVQEKELEIKKVKGKIELIEKELVKLNEHQKELKELQVKHGHAETVYGETEEKIFELIEEEKKIGGEIAHARKFLKELEEVSQNCPLCRNAISEADKQKLKDERKREILSRDQKERDLRERIKSLKGKKSGLLVASLKSKELTAILANLNPRKEELNELKERITHLSSAHFESKKDLIENKERELEKIRKERMSIQEEIEKERKELKELTEKLTRADAENEKDLLVQEKTFSSKQIEELERESREFSGKKVLLEKEINGLNDGSKNIELKLKESSREILQLMEKQGSAEKLVHEKLKKKESLGKQLEKLKEKIDSFDLKERKLEREINDLRLDARSFEVKAEDIKEELEEYKGIEMFKTKPLKEMKEELVHLEKKMSSLGTINLKALESYKEIEKDYKEMNEKVVKLEEERESVIKLINNIEVKRNNIFMDCFDKVNANFKKLFSNFFGIEAFLDLTEPEKPLDSGLLLQIIKNKKGINIDSLSGGEKTLTALAFIFSLQLFDPSTFYALDEPDAALDKQNSLKIARMIKEISKSSQFLAITHNDNLIMNADQIIGVALSEDNSSVIGLDLKEKAHN